MTIFHPWVYNANEIWIYPDPLSHTWRVRWTKQRVWSIMSIDLNIFQHRNDSEISKYPPLQILIMSVYIDLNLRKWFSETREIISLVPYFCLILMWHYQLWAYRISHEDFSVRILSPSVFFISRPLLTTNKRLMFREKSCS